MERTTQEQRDQCRIDAEKSFAYAKWGREFATDLLDDYADAVAALKQKDEEWSGWGVVEVAVRNRQVAEYMEHWEGRATKAEAKVEQLTQALEAAKPYVERVHKQLWRTEFTAGGPAALAVAEVADVVDAALSSTGTAEQGQEQA